VRQNSQEVRRGGTGPQGGGLKGEGKGLLGGGGGGVMTNEAIAAILEGTGTQGGEGPKLRKGILGPFETKPEQTKE